MSPFFALVLGVVEGFTEYLPVSSTGHLVLMSYLLGDSGEGAKAFDIVIQLGAILAVVVHYRALLLERVSGLFTRDPRAISLAVALALGFLPAAVVGVLLRRTIKEHLFGPVPVAFALLVGGIVMIAIERYRKARSRPGLDGLEHVTPRRALLIGVGQCFSLWPGSSRSMCTIVAGQLTGLSTATAAEFSFLLALPTLMAATLYEAVKSRHELMAAGAGLDLAIGMVISFLVAWAVIAGFLQYLKHRGLEPFGYYRIALAALVFFVVLR